MEQRKITRVRLSDGRVYSFFDTGAMRVDPATGVIFTGIESIDKDLILNKGLRITQIDDADVNNYTSILVTDTDGCIKKRPKNTFLRDDLDAHTSVDMSGKLTIALPTTQSGE